MTTVDLPTSSSRSCWATRGDASDELRRAMGELIGVPPDHVTLFWRGRVALYAILRSLGIGPGDEVIVPAFTCVAVPNAVLYAGATPVYVDIDERTYTADPAAVATAMGPRTRAVLAQNTFGLSSDLDALSAVAAAHGAVVIDDCTHGLGGSYGAGPTAPRPTLRSSPRNGASRSPPASAASQSPLIRGSRASSGGRAPPRSRPSRIACCWGRCCSRGSGSRRRAPCGPAAPSTARRVVPASFPAPRAGASSRGRRCRVFRRAHVGVPGPPGQPAPGHAGRQGAPAARDRRALLGVVGRARADGRPRAESAHHAFLRYPLRVRERDAFVEEAARRGLDLGDWFHSPLYPIGGDLSAWGYRWGTNPVAERVQPRSSTSRPTSPPRSGSCAPWRSCSRPRGSHCVTRLDWLK